MRFVRALAGPLFVLAGAMHFVQPRTYQRIMPPYLPRHRELVYASGIAETVGGLGLLPQATRRLAGWWLIATLTAVFPEREWVKTSERIRGSIRHFETVGRPPVDLQHQLRQIERVTRAVDRRFDA